MAHRPHTNPARGVALVAVLWIIAALSLMVTGLSQSIRGEIKTVTTSKQMLAASALSQGATQLALQKIHRQTPPVKGLERMGVDFEGQHIPVEIMPLNGLIDLNMAEQPLLAQMFATLGGIDKSNADFLAKALLDARNAPDSKGRALKFEAPEELMRVQGMSFPLYAKIAPFVTTDSRGGGRVNPMAAPFPVLAILAEGDAARAFAFLKQREAGQTNPDSTMLNGQYLDSSSSDRLQIQARVMLEPGRQFVRTSIVTALEDPKTGMPWSIHYSSQRIDSGPPPMFNSP